MTEAHKKAMELYKAHAWLDDNILEVVASLKELVKVKGKLDAMIERLEKEARAKLNEPKKAEKP